LIRATISPYRPPVKAQPHRLSGKKPSPLGEIKGMIPIERIDDLQINNLKLIQNTEQFCFGVDAVLLTHFAATSKGKSPHHIVDLCCGNGIIPVLLTAKTEARYIAGVEIQPEVAELAKRNVELNNLGERVEIICEDLREIVTKHPSANAATLFTKEGSLAPNSIDLITCNPPYKEAGGGLINAADTLTIARHEVCCALSDIISVSAKLLVDGGRLCVIHRPERLVDLLTLMRQNRLEPKRMQMVHPKPSKTANLVLIEAAKYGKPKLFLESPLYVYNENGEYSDEINEIYERQA